MSIVSNDTNFSTKIPDALRVAVLCAGSGRLRFKIFQALGHHAIKLNTRVSIRKDALCL